MKELLVHYFLNGFVLGAQFLCKPVFPSRCKNDIDGKCALIGKNGTVIFLPKDATVTVSFQGEFSEKELDFLNDVLKELVVNVQIPHLEIFKGIVQDKIIHYLQ